MIMLSREEIAIISCYWNTHSHRSPHSARHSTISQWQTAVTRLYLFRLPACLSYYTLQPTCKAPDSHMSSDVAPITVQQYAVDLSSAVSRQDGGTAAAILSLHDRLAIERIYRGLPYSTARSIGDNPHLQEFRQIFVSSQLDFAGQSAWSSIASKHIASIAHLAQVSSTTEQDNQRHNLAAFEAHLDLAKWVASG